MTPDRVKDTIVHPAASRARDSRMHRMLWLAFALLVAGVVAMFVRSELLRSQVDDLSELSAHNSAVAVENSTAAHQLADQVRALGAVPVTQPAPGPAGTPGAQGTPGATGAQGVPGRDGKDGAPGAQGVPGRDGQNGVDGNDGAAGKDGVDGQDGKDGAQGPAGPQGIEGKQGPPGPSCPDGYTAQSRQQGAETWWVCVADETKPTETPGG